ncbi:hypothetical protein [Gilliamella apis]|uniref:hypothetical protein n=2 Tax=Gilliamella apis TaxID=1970738 RepID=UPI000A345345|nr:hypothetical protein [Gilliamella apis]OTQ66669.1 hypothetical protein B6C89_07100 [Gilliamella apis]OTQ68865.1 hypothetical protein B6D10_06000 [Gilliamella apis]
MVLVLTVIVLQSISFANYALTTKTTNIIYGSAPYLTFDGGRTRVTNTEALLGITLSDGRRFTPTTNNSSLANPIELPVIGQSFADIGMLVPRNTDSIALNSLIRAPYNYWGDDDGDGQGVNGITATGSLNLSIVDKNNQAVTRNEVLTSCNSPYKLTLSNSDGILKTRYGVPNESRFSAGNATYYINPKAAPAICYAKNSDLSSPGISAAVWESDKGFLPQSVTPSSYGSNFPTTGANGFYFDLDIGGVSRQALSWAPVSHGGITATMTDSPDYWMVRVTLTGPFAPSSQWQVQYPSVGRPSLPQVFELVGRDSSGNAVLKYGFELKQWFVVGGGGSHSFVSSWCNNIGYRLPKVKDLTNGSCLEPNSDECRNYGNEINALTATPLSPIIFRSRHIGAGFFTEWGKMYRYTGANFSRWIYWTNDKNSNQIAFMVDAMFGYVSLESSTAHLVCVYP